MDASQLIATLQDERHKLTGRYAEMVVDQLLNTPISQLVTEPEVLAIVRADLTEAALRHLFETHVTPIVERCRAALAQSETKGRDWVSPQAQAALADLLQKPDGPRFTYFGAAVDPTLTRKLLAPVFQDVLLGFVAKLPSVLGASVPGAAGNPTGSDGGLFGRLGREMGGRGRMLMDVGRSVVGGLGLEQKLQPLAADFSQQAVSAFRDSLQKRTQTPEGKQLISELVSRGMQVVLDVPLDDINRDLSRIPLPELLAILPEAVGFAATQPLFESLLEQEVKHYYGTQGDRPLAAVLDDHQLRGAVQATLLRATEAHAEALFASAPFLNWIQQWLQASAAPPTDGPGVPPDPTDAPAAEP